MRCNRKRLGISSIVGTLIMLAMVTTLGVLSFTYASGAMSNLSGSYATAMSYRTNAAEEKFTVEQVAFTFPSLAIDGSSTNRISGSSSSIAATLSTAKSSDVIIAYVSPADAGTATPPAVSGISGGGLTWTHRVTTPTETAPLEYVAMTLTNNAGSATPNPFQQMISWNPSSYSSYEASDLGNIRFCADSACVSPLYAWLESCTSSCSPSATSATAWVKLTSSIAASGGTLTIYMVFWVTSTEFDGVYWGEAPQLSSSYAKYDNGANVFSFYDNFAGSSLNSKWTTVGGYSGSVSNGLTLTSSSDYGGITASFSSSQNTVIDSLATENALQEFSQELSSTNTLGSTIGVEDGYMSGWTNTGSATDQNIVSVSTSAQTTLATSTYSMPSGTAEVLSFAWGTSGALAILVGYTSEATATSTTYTSGSYYSLLVWASASYFVQWTRARAYPPGGTMPSVTPGSPVNGGVTFDLEEWYAISTSPLSSATVTATLSSSDTAATWIAVFGVSGAYTASPFDTNPLALETSSGTSPSTTMSTSNANDVLLYACAANSGSMASSFTGLFSNTFPPDQNEYVGYDLVSTTQTNLATSCGSNSYGVEITDAIATYPGAYVYVRNVGTIPTTLVSVYVFDQSTGTQVGQFTISMTANVGNYVNIPPASLEFAASHGHTYTFDVASSLGNSVIYTAKAT